MKNIIFYFTGTGNSMNVATEIGRTLGDTQLVRVTENTNLDYTSFNFDRLGIIYPVYFGAVPYLLKKFIGKVKLPRAKYCFIVSTCGGMAAGSNDQVRRLLSKKNMKVDAGYNVVMPSNNQTKYPPSGNMKDILKTSDISIIDISNAVKKKLSKPVSKSFMSLIAPPISRFMFPRNSDKGFEVENSCNSCGLCAKVCPAKNIKLKKGKPTWLHDCSRCTACLQLCPQKAIQFGSSREWGRYNHPSLRAKDLIVK